MPPDSLKEQLIKYLTDAHSIEEQALAQMEHAPDLAGDPSLAELFARHREETVGHERRVRELLETFDAKPAPINPRPVPRKNAVISAFRPNRCASQPCGSDSNP